MTTSNRHDFKDFTLLHLGFHPNTNNSFAMKYIGWIQSEVIVYSTHAESIYWGVEDFPYL